MDNRAIGIAKRVAIVEAFIRMSRMEGRPPTLRDLAEELHIGRSTCHYHVERLIAEGVLGRRYGTRGLYLISRAT
jgi:DNA-binding Lrp family transcriptional regulator